MAVARTLRLAGSVPPELWNRLGTKILPKLRSGSGLRIGIECAVSVNADAARTLAAELRQVLHELGLAEAVRVEESEQRADAAGTRTGDSLLAGGGADAAASS